MWVTVNLNMACGPGKKKPARPRILPIRSQKELEPALKMHGRGAVPRPTQPQAKKDAQNESEDVSFSKVQRISEVELNLVFSLYDNASAFNSRRVVD